MSEGFGARLRRRREEQHIALGTIAEQTKIKQSLLEALEREDISHWPTGIFRRAFVRAYAHAINLDPDEVVREFAETFPEPDEVVTTAAIAAAADAARGAAGPPNRFRSFINSAVGSLSRRPRVSESDRGTADVTLPDRPDAPADVGPVEPEHYLPRGLNRMEQALDLISAAGRSPAPPEPEVDFVAIARLCTHLAQVEHASEIRPLLQEAAGILNAIGAVVWVWDRAVEELRPALASGYSDAVLAHLPNVRRDAENVTATAFRSGRMCSIDGVDRGALVIPLVVPGGCSGVLALELQGNTLTKSLQAAATIVAAQLSQLVSGADAAVSVDPGTAGLDSFAPPLLRAGA